MTFSIVKDPDAVLDYAIDWGSNWLSSDTIASSSWAVSGPDDSLTVDSDSNTTTTATVWLSGGTRHATYTVTNSIVTAEGREDDRSIVIRVENK